MARDRDDDKRGPRKPRPPGDRPHFSKKPGGKPRFDKERGERPRSAGRPGERPRFGDRKDRPDGGRPARASFEKRGDRPQFDKKPGGRPRFDKEGGDRPRSAGKPGERPRFGDRKDRPDSRPARAPFEQRGERPQSDRKPGGRPRFNKDGAEGRTERPRFDKLTGDRPRFGNKAGRAPRVLDSIAKSAPAEVEPLRAEPERIAKVMARAGLCSRREAEAWIEAGRVTVNGKLIASPALDVTPQDKIVIDGAPLPQRERTRLFLYYKPEGLVTTNSDPEGRTTIFDRLPKHLPRLLTIGRLDIGTEGLLLLTNDGGLARVLELPDTGWLRRYRVRALGSVTQDDLDGLRDGVEVDGIQYGPIEATVDRVQGANAWLTFAIREGKNREVRNVLSSIDLQVNRLIRLSYGPFQLGELKEGEVEEVKSRVLRDQLGERIVEDANCDFFSPIVEREPVQLTREDRRKERHAQRRDDLRRDTDTREPPRSRRIGADAGRDPSDEESQGRPRRGHAWRKDDAPLRRHYRGAGDEPREPKKWLKDDVPSEGRAGVLTDRKGRNIPIERFGTKKPEEPKPPARKPGRRTHRADRSGGPRPSRPKPR